MALLRILHITNALGSGGAERLVTDLALTQAAAGHSVSVAVLSPSDALGDTSGLDARRTNALEAAGVTVDLLSPRGRALLVPAAVRLRQRMRSVRPDIVHCHLLKGLLVLRMAGQDVPAIATHHNTPLPTRPWLFRSLARRAACYVAISAAAEPVLRDVYDGPVPVIFNGIAPASISGIPRPAAPPLRILSVGNLKPAKNYPQLADIAAELRKNGVDTSISIVGEGSERRVIEAQVAARGVAGRVTLLGSRQDVPELMQSHHIYCAPSRWEGMPIALIEALQAGLPVVAADVGGCGDLIGRDDRCGFLVQPGDTSSFAARIAHFAHDPDLRARMGAAGQERAAAFSIDHAAREYERVYRSVLG